MRVITLLFICCAVLSVYGMSAAQATPKDTIWLHVLEERVKKNEEKTTIQFAASDKTLASEILRLDNKIQYTWQNVVSIGAAAAFFLTFFGWKALRKDMERATKAMLKEKLSDKFIEDQLNDIKKKALADFDVSLKKDYEKQERQAIDNFEKLRSELRIRTKMGYFEEIHSTPENKYSFYDWYFKGMIESKKSLFTEAINSLEYAKALNPEEPNIYVNLGDMFRREGQFYRALEALDKAIGLDPSNATACFNKALVYVDMNKFEYALEFMNKAIEIEPASLELYISRGDVYIALGQFNKAIDDLTVALAIEPSNDLAYNLRAKAFLSNGAIDKAIVDYKKASHIHPCPDYLFNLAELFITNGLTEEALETILKAHSLKMDTSQQAISLYLEGIIKKLLGLDTDEVDKKYSQIMEKCFKIIWSVDEIMTWAGKADITESLKGYINEKTNRLNPHIVT